MGDAADIDRVRQQFVDVPPAERAAAGRAACAIDANRNPQTLGVEGLLEADDASRFEIAPEQGRRSPKATPPSTAWGVHSVSIGKVDSLDEIVESARKAARDEGFAAPGNIIAITAGTPFNVPGTTDLLKLAVA